MKKKKIKDNDEEIDCWSGMTEGQMADDMARQENDDLVE